MKYTVYVSGSPLVCEQCKQFDADSHWNAVEQWLDQMGLFLEKFEKEGLVWCVDDGDRCHAPKHTGHKIEFKLGKQRGEFVANRTDKRSWHKNPASQTFQLGVSCWGPNNGRKE